MIKTIKIGEKEVALNNNIGWLLIYKDQFGRDIIPALMPMIQAIIDLLAAVFEETGSATEIGIEDVLKASDNYKVTEAMVHLSGLELTDIINIIWALAKNEDESLPEPKRWIKQFDSFYLDEILPDVIELIGKGVISSKNLSRLQKAQEVLKPEK